MKKIHQSKVKVNDMRYCYRMLSTVSAYPLRKNQNFLYDADNFLMGKKVDSRIVQNAFLGSAVWFCGVSDYSQGCQLPSPQTLRIAVITVISGFDSQTRLMGHFPLY